jgi:hypothetical protein
MAYFVINPNGLLATYGLNRSIIIGTRHLEDSYKLRNLQLQSYDKDQVWINRLNMQTDNTIVLSKHRFENMELSLSKLGICKANFNLQSKENLFTRLFTNCDIFVADELIYDTKHELLTLNGFYLNHDDYVQMNNEKQVEYLEYLLESTK